MSRFVITRGLPASGKTTQALEWLAQSPDTRGRVNRDDLRALMFGTTSCTFQQEELVTTVQRTIAKTLLDAGLDVIVDDMHLRPKYVRKWRKFAAAHGGVDVFEIREFTTWPDVAIERDAERGRAGGRSVGADVITGLARKYMPNGQFLPVPDEVEPPTPDRYEAKLGTEPAIIVDIDGTVALMGDRGPYDLDRVGDDEPNHAVIEAVRAAYHEGYAVVFCSGREDSCRDATEQWLDKHVRVPGPLFMRAAGDKRRDSIVKRELFDAHIREQYDVRWVYDDRRQVVTMWRDLGLTVMQVADGDF